jgi:CHAT domain-containing protein
VDSRSSARALALLLLLLFGSLVHARNMDSADPVAPYHAAHEAFARDFQITGSRDPSALQRNIPPLQALAAAARGDTRVRALLEIAYIQRVSNAFAKAAYTYAQAAQLAAQLGRSDLVFESSIGAARSLGSAHEHGTAAQSLERAVSAAGAHPTRKQRYEMALYQADLASERGEIESSLVAALDAVRLAPAADDRFYAELDVSAALEALAASCDYRPLRDSRSSAAPGDVWAACHRAVSAARAAYTRAVRTAEGLGWRYLVGQTQSMQSDLATRDQLIGASDRQMPDPKSYPQLSSDFVRFTPRTRQDVLVVSGDLERNWLGVSMHAPAAAAPLVPLLKGLISYRVQSLGGEDASTIALRSDLEGMQAGNTDRIAGLMEHASKLLMAERASFFDPRRRGTVIERQAGLFAKLALSLLALRRDEEAFNVFELARARGLGELTELLGRPDVTAEERVWLAQQVKLDAQSSATEQSIVASVISGGGLDRRPEELDSWEASNAQRRAHLTERADFRAKLTRSSFTPPRLAELQRASASTGIPVLLYWVANPNVYIWSIGPHASDFRSVFLPVAALREKLVRLQSISDEQGALDEAVARQLYLYLIAPVVDVLDAQQILIVPQGEIVDVPFEVLRDPNNGRFLVEEHSISYVPNAAVALQALSQPLFKVRAVNAIVDVEIDDGTHETAALRTLPDVKLQVLNAADVVPAKLGESLRHIDAAHLLMHGEFKSSEPLLSSLSLSGGPAPVLTAADLLAVSLHGLRLVVMSACESAEQQHRVSNEVYGFPWVLLAAGAENVVTSRWRVNGASNSDWMNSFYAAVAAGASPAQAAAEAMRAMIKAQHRSPYYWAAMQVSGR